MEDVDMESKEFLRGSDLSQIRRITRPNVKTVKQDEDDLVFMQIDVDQYTKQAPGKLSHSLLPPEHIKTSIDSTVASTLRIFGINEKGNSICCNVHNFIPYFYVEAPANVMVTPQDAD